MYIHFNSGLLKPGGTVVEGTAGNTGIGLAHICKALGYKCVIYMPDTQSEVTTDLIHSGESYTAPYISQLLQGTYEDYYSILVMQIGHFLGSICIHVHTCIGYCTVYTLHVHAYIGYCAHTYQISHVHISPPPRWVCFCLPTMPSIHLVRFYVGCEVHNCPLAN